MTANRQETNVWMVGGGIASMTAAAFLIRDAVLRFVQEFPRLNTLSGVRRTVYNQYDSIVVPLRDWLRANYVDVRFGVTATDADFADDGGPRFRAAKHVLRQCRRE